MERSGAGDGSSADRFEALRSEARATTLGEESRAQALDEASAATVDEEARARALDEEARARAFDEAGRAESGAVFSVGGATILDDPALGVEQRILLGTDATVVRLLEGCFEEAICTANLEQVSTPPLPTDAELELSGEETILRRKTLLQGSRSGQNYVYAEASVVLDRVAPALREALLSTAEPIGRLLAATRVETFRELVRAGWMPARQLGEHFGLQSGDELLSRTYRIIAGGRPAMLITEIFPPRFLRAQDSRPGALLSTETDS